MRLTQKSILSRAYRSVRHNCLRPLRLRFFSLKQKISKNCIFYTMAAIFHIRRPSQDLATALHLGHSTISIVGNGPSEVGLSKGSDIDSADYIIRFNNFSLAPEHSPDYGKRFNVWATSCNRDVFPCVHPFKYMLVPIPIFDSTYKDRYLVSHKLLLPHLNKLLVIPSATFKELNQYCDNPSTGLSLLFWLYSENGRNLDGIRIYGFSFFQSKYHHYFSQTGRCLHNGNDEEILVSKMLAGSL